MSKQVEIEERLVPGPMIVTDDKGHSLELTTWRNEPAVIVDGKHILRYSVIARQFENYVIREDDGGVYE
jgi:hypothetical protein